MRVSRRLAVPILSFSHRILLAALLPLVAPNAVLAAEVQPPSTIIEEPSSDEPPLGSTEFIDVQTPVIWESTQLAPRQPQLTEPIGTPWRGFARGHCTFFVASKRKITFRGDAKRWPANAAAAGYRLSDDPVVGAVVVTKESRYGHVAYVERVNGDGTFLISEMNYVGRYKVSTRTLHIQDSRIVTFIL